MAYKRRDVVRILILRTLGNFFILFTIFGFFATFGPAIYYEVLYRWSVSQGIKFEVGKVSQKMNEGITPLGKIIAERESASHASGSASNPIANTDSSGETYLGAILSGQKEHVLIPESTSFAVVIPKIGANETVTPNVDPSDPNQYLPVLQHTVAHAKGSAFPGMDGNIYLFAHSADSFWNVGRYNAVFYLLSKLSNGDDITLFFQDKRYDYTVYDSKIVEADDISHISADLGQGERLILQTCWPPGTSWKRLLVFAKPNSSE